MSLATRNILIPTSMRDSASYPDSHLIRSRRCVNERIALLTVGLALQSVIHADQSPVRYTLCNSSTSTCPGNAIPS
jgi:hypothetical protein